MFQYLTMGTMLAFLDQTCKAKIEAKESASFPIEPEEAKGYIRLQKIHNPGFSFGFLKENPEAVKLVPFCVMSALAGVWAYVCTLRGNCLKKLGLTMAMAGGASNLYDRVKRGFVVDYINIRIGCLKKLVFNQGDAYIVIGAALFVLSEMIGAVKEVCQKK